MASIDESDYDSSDDECIDFDVYDLIPHTLPLDPEVWEFPFTDLRRAKLILFGSVLREYPAFRDTYTKDEQRAIIRRIESTCTNFAIDTADAYSITAAWEFEKFTELYTSICARISIHMETGGLVGETDLAHRVIADPSIIILLPTLTSAQLFPERYEKILAALAKLLQSKTKMKTTDMYTCSRCGKKECTSLKVILRSADEGCSFRITCVNCGFSFVQ